MKVWYRPRNPWDAEQYDGTNGQKIAEWSKADQFFAGEILILSFGQSKEVRAATGQWLIKMHDGKIGRVVGDRELRDDFVLPSTILQPELDDEAQRFPGLFVGAEQETTIGSLDITEVVFDTYKTSILTEDPNRITVVATHSPTGIQATVESFTLDEGETKGRAFAALEKLVEDQ